MEPQREKSEAVSLDNSIEELLDFEPEVTAPTREDSTPPCSGATVQPAKSKDPPAASPKGTETENVLNYIKP